MTDERTEGLALSQVLRISVGGEIVELRTLTMVESDAWLQRLTGSVDIDIGGISGDAESLATLLSLPAHAALTLIGAYDLDSKLPEGYAERMTKREVKAALEAMADAEDPFGEGAVRLVDEVFGAPSRFLGTLTRIATDAVASRMGESLSGVSEPGASTTTETSAPAGAGRSSSSSGSTATNGRRTKRSTIATLSPTG